MSRFILNPLDFVEFMFVDGNILMLLGTFVFETCLYVVIDA